jgi:4a-hydroxytetrahydrobiopterin dehydratase
MSAHRLADRKCEACTEQTPRLESPRIAELLAEVPGWQVTADGHRLSRSWRVRDFLTGLDFFRRIGEVAEAEDHHPDLHLVGYRNLTVELWTHVAGGLTENDFILAAKINELEPPALKAH